MDPRIHERRLAVRRDEGRRRLRILVMAVSVVALLAGGYGLTRTSLLDVDRVVVQGTARTPPADVIRAAGLRGSHQMADVDTAAVRRGVERLPWVARATVERRWPGTVKITLQERTAAAAMAAVGGGWATVDATGRVVAVGADQPAGLVTIAGVTAPALGATVGAAAKAALTVLEALPSSLDGRLRRLDAGEAGVVVHLDGAPPVLLGPTTQLGEKLTALTTLLARVDVKGAGAIDVRVPAAPVVAGAAPSGVNG